MLKIASTREYSAVCMRRCNPPKFGCLQINTSESGNVSFFSSFRGHSIGVTHTINWKIEKFDIFIFTSKHIEKKNTKKIAPPPEIVLTSLFKWLLINLNSPPLNASLCQNFVVASNLQQLGQNRAANLQTKLHTVRISFL